MVDAVRKSLGLRRKASPSGLTEDSVGEREKNGNSSTAYWSGNINSD